MTSFHGTISGDDYNIYYLSNSFFVSYLSSEIHIDEEGTRRGRWSDKYILEYDGVFDDIYEFVKDIKDNNDLELNMKKYNL
jgi:hypothetical protein